jgi:uncharacterized membrane-anchored protein YitT (DUF2179 family)
MNYNLIKKYIFVLIGGLFLSIGVAVLLAPNLIASGGTPGLAIVLNHYLDMQLGLLMFLINAPMILLSMKYISKGFAFRTIFSICVTAFSVDFIYEFLKYEGLIIDTILASIFGGVFVGLGLGLIIMGNAAAGGPFVLAKLIAQKLNFKEENIIIALDVLIVVSAGIAFESIESTFLSLISVYISLKAIDIILSGRANFKMVHISTKEAELLRKEISNSLDLKGSIVEARGLKSNENKKIIMLVCESSRIFELRTLIQKFDKDSFIVVGDVSEIMGRGH